MSCPEPGKIAEDDLLETAKSQKAIYRGLANVGLRQAGIGHALGKSSSVIWWRCKVILLNLKSRIDETNCLKSSSGDVISESLKPLKMVLCSSREIVSLNFFFKLASPPVFNSRSNEPSHAPQFKWLASTFKYW
jgi:hypothetical protein